MRTRQPKAQEPRMPGRLDRRVVEMFGLELTMLAKAHGLDVARMEIKAVKRSTRG